MHQPDRQRESQAITTADSRQGDATIRFAVPDGAMADACDEPSCRKSLGCVAFQGTISDVHVDLPVSQPMVEYSVPVVCLQLRKWPSPSGKCGIQNVLHAQSLGTLFATCSAGLPVRRPLDIILRCPVGPAKGVGGPLSMLLSSLLFWLFLRRMERAVSQRWYCRWQTSHARDGSPSGWNFADWSRGIV